MFFCNSSNLFLAAGSAETSNKKNDAPAAAEAAGSDDLESFLNDLEI